MAFAFQKSEETMTEYIKFNKGIIDAIPNPKKRTRFYHNEIKGAIT